jgi:7-cyano-7-deazaguanine synthase
MTNIPSRTVLLLSGGVDSLTAGAVARAHGAEIYALSFDYQQVNRKELESAAWAAISLGAREHHVMKLGLGLGTFGRSTLLSQSSKKVESKGKAPIVSGGDLGIYVPARNTVLLACALSYAEMIEAQSIVVGASCVAMGAKPSRYKDCHPEFYLAFQDLAHLAVQLREEVQIFCPLMYLNKKETIGYGLSQNLDYSQTWTCYTDGENHCGQCSACEMRLYAFHSLHMKDPAPYEKGFDYWVDTYQERWQTVAKW